MVDADVSVVVVALGDGDRRRRAASRRPARRRGACRSSVTLDRLAAHRPRPASTLSSTRRLRLDRQRLRLHLAGRRVEQDQRAVEAAEGELLLVGPHGQRQRRPRAVGVDLALDHLGGVPRLDDAVLAQRVERLAVGGVDQPQHRPFVGEDGVDELAVRRRRPPRRGCSCRRRRPRGACRRGYQATAVDPVGRFAERVEPLAGRDVPDLDGPVGRGGGEQLAVGAEGRRRRRRRCGPSASRSSLPSSTSQSLTRRS